MVFVSRTVTAHFAVWGYVAYWVYRRCATPQSGVCRCRQVCWDSIAGLAEFSLRLRGRSAQPTGHVGGGGRGGLARGCRCARAFPFFWVAGGLSSLAELVPPCGAARRFRRESKSGARRRRTLSCPRSRAHRATGDPLDSAEDIVVGSCARLGPSRGPVVLCRSGASRHPCASGGQAHHGPTYSLSLCAAVLWHFRAVGCMRWWAETSILGSARYHFTNFVIRHCPRAFVRGESESKPHKIYHTDSGVSPHLSAIVLGQVALCASLARREGAIRFLPSTLPPYPGRRSPDLRSGSKFWPPHVRALEAAAVCPRELLHVPEAETNRGVLMSCMLDICFGANEHTLRMATSLGL